MARVSVIIPVYNTEKYLRECVTSVFSQSYADLEIILVNDGSKDNSPSLCDEFCSQDARVRVMHKENEGLSMARNDGLALAKGDYVLFLDSDDFWIGKDFLKSLLEFAESHDNNFSYIEFNRSRFFPSENLFVKCPSFPVDLYDGCNSGFVINELVKNGIFPMSACTKLFRRDFLTGKGIAFIKGLFSEDIPWFCDVLRKAELPIYYVNTYSYGNRAEVSTSLTSTFSVKKYRDVIDIINNQVKLIDADDWPEDVKDSLRSFLAYRYCILLAQYAKHKVELSEDLIKSTKSLAYLLKYDNHPKVRKTSIIYRLFGMKLTAFFLSFYMENRETINRKKASVINKFLLL